MSYPTKANGWRTIVVGDRQFRWKLHSGTITLQGDLSTGQQAIIVLKDRTDPWLSISEPSGQTQSNEPRSITPSFVSEAVRFALSVAWKPEVTKAPLYIDFEDGAFKLPNNETNAEPPTIATP